MRPDDSLKVLVVDDSVDGAEMLAAALSAKGYDTRWLATHRSHSDSPPTSNQTSPSWTSVFR
jgi:CheY-like chemotaxis protein